MNKPTISIIAAIGKKRELGADNKLLWQIPEDMKRFRETTFNHPIIMGRKTYESIGRPLPKRTNIIITRDRTVHVSGGIVVHTLGEALKKAEEVGSDEIFIIGGGQIYEQAINLTDKLYLTIVDKEYKEADTFFPNYQDFQKILSKKEGVEGTLRYTFLELMR